MTHHYVIQTMLVAVIGLVVWIALFFLWGSGSNNPVGRMMRPSPVVIVAEVNSSDAGTVVTTADTNNTRVESAHTPAAPAPVDVPPANQNELRIVIDKSRPRARNNEDEDLKENDSELIQGKDERIAKQTEDGPNKKPSSNSRTTIVREHAGGKGTNNDGAGSDDSLSTTNSAGNNPAGNQNLNSADNGEAPAEGITAALIDSTNSFPAGKSGVQSTQLPLDSSAPSITLALTLTFDYQRDSCTEEEPHQTAWDIYFRRQSSAIKGFSLVDVENMIGFYGRCNDASFTITPQPSGIEDATITLQQRRRDELYYYLVHMSVDKSDIVMLDPQFVTVEQP